MWLFGRKGPSGFSGSSTAEEVTHGIDGSGLTALVTGASSGIGAETARVLALCGVHVVMGVRNVDAGKKLKDKIVQEIPAAKVDTMELDLSSMASVRKFASEYNASNRPLNLLICSLYEPPLFLIICGHVLRMETNSLSIYITSNNAGVMATPFMLSKDNIELQFATNHLGHFLLTHLLLDTMKKTARESGKEGRVVNVSSEAHRFPYPEGIRFDKLSDPSGYNSWRAYGQSKLANILHANQLTKHLKDDGVEITANSLHPGAINTNLFRHISWMNGVVRMMGKFVLKSVEQGAATTCYVALHPQVKGVSGEYFSDCNLANPSKQAQDATLAQKLWDFSIKRFEGRLSFTGNPTKGPPCILVCRRRPLVSRPFYLMTTNGDCTLSSSPILGVTVSILSSTESDPLQPVFASATVSAPLPTVFRLHPLPPPSPGSSVLVSEVSSFSAPDIASIYALGASSSPWSSPVSPTVLLSSQPLGSYAADFGSFVAPYGATSGIGAETACELALRGVCIIMGVRNVAASKNFKDVISRDIPYAKIDAMETSALPLHNNAGTMAMPCTLSKDNIELQFETNHLGKV
ncbi:hypothetical protein Cgig2_012479 [Carnegiea gigantea]|uniref:Short-chain dehydrogenase TIC 32, chloroplastic n=1 Tax=Carnegiea gigantea TaxID=171969 RepID=A0A9Q1K5I3_9CARY|nr:hypothetical protein Cgig2_012479 [Carnegiea gigantea]